MANPTIGRIRCPLSGEMAEVRKYSKGTKKLYYVSSFGMITPNSAAGQAWMMDNAEIWGEGREPVNEERPEQIPAEKPGEPVNEEKPVKRRKSFLDILMSEDE